MGKTRTDWTTDAGFKIYASDVDNALKQTEPHL
jgi:hypothetical protein